MKKILALLIVLTLVVSMFTGCEFPELPFGPETPDDQVTPDDGNNDQNNDTTTEGSTLEDAKTVLRDLYKDKLATTAVNFTVVTQVMVGEDKYEVIWSTNNDKIVVGEPDEATKSVTIAVPSQAVEKIEYVLTATIKAADGTTLEVTFDAAVPKFEVNSHADYMAAAKDDELTIMGVVVGINSVARGNKYNHLFLADTSVDGGYYCYKVTTDPSDLGIELGMTVAVTGKMSPYNGMQEIINGQVEVLDTTIRSFETLDITDKFAAGADLGAYVGLPVSIKGVTLGSQDLETASSQYLYFSIGEKQAYVRTYITDFPVDLQADRDNVKATIDADHAAHFGYKADVEGILVLFSGNPYLIPTSVTPFTNYQQVEKTPAEKVAAEIGELKFDASYSNDAIIDLILTGKYYNDVTFAWTTSDATNAAIADGKLTLKVPNETTTVTITVTVACGEVTQTKEFTIKLSKTITTITDALAIGAAKEHNTYTEEKYIVAGIIKEVYNATYGNMYLVDELGNTFTVYGTYSADGANRYDAMEAKPVAGDYVVIIGVLGQYNGTAQMKNGWIQSFTTPITIPQANELGNTFEKNQYTEDKKVITGEITEVQNTTYGNVVIKDAEGNSILVYGLYNANGLVRYDAMATKPAVGDTITVLGIIGKYNAPQMKNGWLIGYTAGAGETPAPHEHNFVEGKCECGETDPNYQPPSGGETPEAPVWGVIEAPVAGTAYKFGMVQGKLNDGNVYYLKGGMSGYYMATTTNVDEAIDVYLEATEGGYYLYAMINGAKTYINMVVSGTHVNGAYEANASTVYTYDAESKTVIATVNNAPYWFGTRNDNTYTTVGPCATSYNGFYCQFYGTTAGETPAPHEHNFVEGKCECGETDPNYQPPSGGETPEAPVVGGGSADFNTIVLPSSKPNGDSSYTTTYTTANGWVSTNAAIQCGGTTDMNPQFTVIGADNTFKAICLNGKTSAPGSLTSPTLNGGVSKIVIKYTKMFTDTALAVTITVTDSNGNKYTDVLSVTLDKNDKYTVYTHEWVLETPVTGDFTIEIVNNCPSNSTSNKDRITILDLTWEGATTGETPAPHEHNFVEGKCECGETDPNYQPPHEHNFVEGKCECGETDPNYQPPAGDGVMSIPEVLASAEGTAVVVKGTVSEIYQAWNDQYGNISFYIVDEAGNRLLIFRTSTLVGIGDQVTVTGKATLYNEVVQIAQGGVTVIDVVHVCSTFTEGSCIADTLCTVCGKVGTPAPGHNYVGGACSVCGEVAPTVEQITVSKTIKELIALYGWTSSTTKQSFTLDEIVSVKINGGSNTGKAYNGDHIRIYATDTPAGTMTITVPEGYELVSIKVTAQTGTYAFFNIDGISGDVCNKTVEVDGNSVVLKSVKNGSDGKQVRVMAIEVVYQPVA